MATPTIQRRRLGMALRRAREEAGKTRDEAATLLDAAATKVSRLELGQSGIRLTDLKLLLDFYGVSGEHAESLHALARAGRQRGRWSGYRNVVPDWFRAYVDLEADATEIRWYQAEIIPGLLQTESYMRALNTTGLPHESEEELDDHVRVRMERTAIIDRPDAPALTFILSESALRRNIGDAAIMRNQLQHLASIAERPGVEVQVYPFSAQSYEVSTFDFIILRFDNDPHSDVVYLENFTDADYLDRLDAVRAYSGLWNRLQAAALGPVESRRLVRRIADEHR
ncbi:transcriptional regulator with XRE-family HTH domain [Lipingzhangella halophila]|uniref:Transcriptional regulator with XRE-family HTH domain n=1 Tax=Lipingzhangella halophila TaxID=1783352 RepID=A0A7W7RED6_9ACTN|nr:helix-turn-helix transcriptional regulator [Lipingzhangella halophila]MBB4930290.1 transcriptional regulator with XRE-family HTH domain [Lipingzhangella halophila]